MKDLNFTIDRTLVICAERKTVFRYFTDSKRFAAWWGEGSTIESKPGGKVRICYPGAVIASGEVLEITNNERIVFTYGYESGNPIPSGSSKVTFIMRDHPEGTEVSFRHEVADEAVRDMHVGGWRYQLAVFATLVSKEQHSNYKKILEDFLALWNNSDSKARKQTLLEIASQNVEFRDSFGCVNDRDELNAHIENSRKFMPGLTLTQNGEPMECQGNAIQSWIATKADGTEAAHGTNTFQFTPTGLIKSVVGFWNGHPAS
jgi:uncharacterized protein YndB with AHSA1/START domain